MININCFFKKKKKSSINPARQQEASWAKQIEKRASYVVPATSSLEEQIIKPQMSEPCSRVSNDGLEVFLPVKSALHLREL